MRKFFILLLLIFIILIVNKTIEAAFVHPGGLNNRAEYDLMRQKVLAGAQPWKATYDALVGKNYLSRTPAAVSTIQMDFTVDCDNANGMLLDGQAAYGAALQWVVTNNIVYANKAKELLNAWANANTSFTGNDQIRLCISWYTPFMAHAAEILKHYDTSVWPSGEQTTFRNWVTSKLVPRFQVTDVAGGTTPKSNWAAYGILSRLAWGVFLDDQALFDKGVTDYRDLVRFYISKFGFNVLDGFTYETCRGSCGFGTRCGGDMTHTIMGLGGFAAAAEIAKKQGVDLYGFLGADDGFGLRTALLAHGQWWDYPTRSGSVNTGWPCQEAFPGHGFEEGIFPNFSWHAVYNHYRDSLLLNLSNFQGNDYSGRRAMLHWDRMTHNYTGLISEDPEEPPPPPQGATIRYASVTGSLTACTESSPCSAQTAIQNAGGGSTIRLFPGTYNIEIDNWLPSGTGALQTTLESWTGTGVDITVGNRELPVSHAPVTIVASTGKAISIRDGRKFIVVRNINFTTSGTGTDFGSEVGNASGTSITSDITFENVDFQAPTRTDVTAALKIYSTTERVKIVKSRLHDVGGPVNLDAVSPRGFGIDICGANHTIEDSDIYATFGSAIQANPCPTGSNKNWRITNNRIFNIGGAGLSLTQAVDPVIADNQIYDIGSYGIHSDGNSQKALIFNNLIKDYSKKPGLNVAGVRYNTGTSGVVRNNIFFAAAGQTTVDILPTAAQVACDNNLSNKSSEVTNCTSWTLNAIEADVWENSAICDWNLKFGSPAKDNGISGICSAADVSGGRCAATVSINNFLGTAPDQGPKELDAPAPQVDVTQLPFDGNFLDSINGNNGTATSVGFDSTNKIAGASSALFNAISDKVVLGTSGFNKKEFTLLISVRAEDLNSATAYIAAQTTCPDGFCDRLQLYLNPSNRFAVGMGGSHTVLTVNNFVPLVDTFYRLVLRVKEGATEGSGTGNLTISGVQVGSFTFTNFNQLASTWTIGNNGGTNTEGWDGQLDELIIANYYYSDADVQADCAQYCTPLVAPFDEIGFVRCDLLTPTGIRCELDGNPNPATCNTLADWIPVFDGVNQPSALVCNIAGNPPILNITMATAATHLTVVGLIYGGGDDPEPTGVVNLLVPAPLSLDLQSCASDVAGLRWTCLNNGNIPANTCDDPPNFILREDCLAIPKTGCSTAGNELTLTRVAPPIDGTVPLSLVLIRENKIIGVENNFVPGSIPPEEAPPTTGVNQLAWWCRPDGRTDATRFRKMQNEECGITSPGEVNIRLAIANESGVPLTGFRTALFCARDDGTGFGSFMRITDQFASFGLKYNPPTPFKIPDNRPIDQLRLTVAGGLTPAGIGTFRRSEALQNAYTVADNVVFEEEFALQVAEGFDIGTRFVCRVHDPFGTALDGYVGEAGCETAGPGSSDACGATLKVGRPRVR